VAEVLFYSFFTSALDESGQIHVPATLPQIKGTGIY